MGLLDRFLGWVERGARRLRAGDEPPRRRWSAGSAVMAQATGGGGHGWAWPTGGDKVEQVLHYRHWTYIAVRAIMSEIGGLAPRVALVRDGEGGGTKYDPLRLRKSLGSIQDHEAVQSVGPQHPLARLFRKPNSLDVACDLFSELVLFLELTGDGYLWCVPSEYGRLSGTMVPAELWVIPSHWVWPKLGPRGVDWYEVRPFSGPGNLKIPPSEVIHFKYKSPVNKFLGHSPQQSGSEWIDAGESIDRSRFYQFKNGCFPIGNLELGEQYNDPDDADLERIYAKFFGRIQGEHNYGLPIITPPGAKYNPLTISPAEMAYVQSADQLRDWVLALYGVPKEIAGIQDAGSEIAMYGPLAQFIQRTIAPKLRYFGQVLTAHLACRYDPDLRVWWDDPTPASPDQINKDLSLDGQMGWVTPNEARAIRGRRPYTPDEEGKYAKPGSEGASGGMSGAKPMPGAAPSSNGNGKPAGRFGQ